ncbi:isoprenyl transferase [Leuconostocaceae bacterium ESL0958]|nr:isoprenyl transferase [Leuconostocaceae bacterium ESL0958]
MPSFWQRLLKKQPDASALRTNQANHLKVPQHLAIIMDGNGRWAKQRHRPRIAGHQEGMETVKRVTKMADAVGVQVLTLYAFSTENWTRPKDEVSFLMKLPERFFNTFVPELVAKNIRVSTIGDVSQLPETTQAAVAAAKEKTAGNTGMILNFALNYGGRHDIVTASQSLAAAVARGELAAEAITEELFAQQLTTGYLGSLADPDLVIRTSGEERLSNFLPYQAAYAEFYFTKVLWPDFGQADFDLALTTYTKRDRRFGGVKS